MIDEYIVKDDKKLRLGYTTGSCAVAATQAALYALLYGIKKDSVDILTPKGISLSLEVLDYSEGADGSVRCGVKKDAGDDPDVTNGIVIYSTVAISDEPGIFIDGGKGVGRVTRCGLDQEVKSAAINSVPRRCISEVCERLILEYNEEADRVEKLSGARIIIDVPGGEEVALNTFNARLGIEGGISIIGTSGIVEPMSENAIIETIRTEIRVMANLDDSCLYITPGNYGMDFLREKFDIDLNKAVKCSNFVGEAMDAAKAAGVKRVCFVGHIGKLVKVAGGIMNTHSKVADCRMEILTAYAAKCGIDSKGLSNILSSVTTDDALGLIKEYGKLDEVCQMLVERIAYHIGHRVQNSFELSVFMFSKEFGLLARRE